jgi:hypothetical protein
MSLWLTKKYENVFSGETNKNGRVGQALPFDLSPVASYL